MLSVNPNQVGSTVKYEVTFFNGDVRIFCDTATAEFNARVEGTSIWKIKIIDKFLITIWNGKKNFQKAIIGKDACRAYVDKQRAKGFKIVGCKEVG